MIVKVTMMVVVGVKEGSEDKGEQIRGG